MENETQNQDTQAAPQQQPVVEEAQAAPEQAMDDTQAATSEVHDDPGIPQQQEQGIAVGEGDPSSPGVEPVSEEAVERLEVMPDGWDDLSSPGVEPVSEEGLNPAEIPDPAVTMTSDDLVGSDPKVTMNPEDLSGPESSENPSDFLAGDDTHSYIELGEPDFTSEGGDAGWISDVPPVSEDEWLDIWNVEDDDSTSIGLDIDGQVKDYADDWSWGRGPSDAEEIVSEDPAPGGYDDILGISKEDIEGPSSDTDGDGASDLDEAREDATPGGYDGSGIAGGLDLDHNGEFDRIENNPDVMSDGEEYTYDEDDYEDAEDAFEDLQDALRDGDEEDRAEALEELRGYLNGFDKGAAEEEDQDRTETQDDQIPSVSDADGDGIEDRADSDPDGDGLIDLSSQPDSDGDGTIDAYDDSDGDGLLDFFEDTDGDGQYDGQDSDKDGNGIDDWMDFDLDGDGIGYGKEDDDGDGIENAKEDTDGDGQYDWQDSDSDGNGIDDWEELLDDPYEFTCF